jgi:intracellular multiplication protein IcmC
MADNWITGNADIIKNIADNMEEVQKLISGFAYIAGLFFILKAVLALKQYGESRTAMSSGQSHLKEPLMYFLVGAFLLFFPSGLAVMLQTTFGESTITEYTAIDSKNPVWNGLFGSGSAVGRSLVIIIQTIGGIAFVRGWILIARGASQGQQPGGTGKGLVHVFGGVLAMNIVSTLQIINNTLYGT